MTRKAIPTLLLISALLHLYIGLRLQPDLAFSSAAQWSLVLWLAISTVLIPAPLLVRLSPIGRYGDALGWIGYLAMGVFSSLFVLTVLRDLIPRIKIGRAHV